MCVCHVRRGLVVRVFVIVLCCAGRSGGVSLWVMFILFVFAECNAVCTFKNVPVCCAVKTPVSCVTQAF